MESNMVIEIKFLEQLLDEGIARIADDLVKEIERSVLIADNYGEIFYSFKNIPDEEIRMIIGQIPSINETEYYFHKTKKILFYQLGEKEHRLVIGIDNVEQDDIVALIEKVWLRSLALKTYLDMQEQLQKKAKTFEKNLVETLLKSSASIYDIIEFYKLDLKTNQYYGILLLEVDKALNIAEVTHAIRKFCQPMAIEGREFFSIVWNDIILAIIPVLDHTDKQTVANIEKMALFWQKKLAEQFDGQFSCGIGRIYMLNNLHKSYIEAKIALVFPSIMGKWGIVQTFDNLGIFSVIFAQEIRSLKEYVLKTVRPILVYDREANMQLVDTLRLLLRNDFNWAKTAKDLFVHVNTIYYRYDKIEKLLNLDLSKGKDRNEVFAALTVWDVLNKIGFIGDDFFQ